MINIPPGAIAAALEVLKVPAVLANIIDTLVRTTLASDDPERIALRTAEALAAEQGNEAMLDEIMKLKAPWETA